MSQLRQCRRVGVTLAFFQDLAYTFMGSLASWRAELLVEAVLDQRMGEAVAIRASPFGEHCRAYRQIDEVKYGILIDLGHSGEDADRELSVQLPHRG